ncbi:5-carboxymethyl-2-hydroxymuconate Delta-isomerase [Paludibacterium paludis]|uniref:5-carboxymethyl-2-hydroxymuconate isomerase n=1 Tax=Paludibacterium paludis TaxID=1225769 RepID=A0A918P6G6_9NEIS|nr:5-carboxymethyl-2-hydroxymuconate Delta-isomerase [Paludibacterium paludis]GGY25431.1 5-carboxymethyl-2-hydroxymuconate isomerase [Paludibacterium paludis]
MPHLTLEYSANLERFDAALALEHINRDLAASGHFEEADIKSRARKTDTFAIGTRRAGRAFVHAKLAILTGRDIETRRALSACVLNALQSRVPAHPGLDIQVCAEIVDIERDSYAKTVVTG